MYFQMYFLLIIVQIRSHFKPYTPTNQRVNLLHLFIIFMNNSWMMSLINMVFESKLTNWLPHIFFGISHNHIPLLPWLSENSLLALSHLTYLAHLCQLIIKRWHKLNKLWVSLYLTEEVEVVLFDYFFRSISLIYFILEIDSIF